MSGIGATLRNQVAPPVVPLPDQTRIAGEGLGSGKLFGPVLPPQTVRTAERRHPARGRHARASHDGETRRLSNPLRDQTNSIIAHRWVIRSFPVETRVGSLLTMPRRRARCKLVICYASMSLVIW